MSRRSLKTMLTGETNMEDQGIDGIPFDDFLFGGLSKRITRVIVPEKESSVFLLEVHGHHVADLVSRRTIYI